jgi:hypothetical protein
VIRCRFDLNHEVFAGGFYDVRWFRPTIQANSSKSPASGSNCGITPSAGGQDLYRGAIQDWLPKRCPLMRTRSSRGGWLPKRWPAGMRSLHGERSRPASVRAVSMRAARRVKVHAALHRELKASAHCRSLPVRSS